MSGSLFVLGKFDDKELSLPNCQPRQSWACLSQRYKESGPLAALDYSSYPAGISPDTARAVLINYRNNQCRTPRGLLRLSVTPRCQEIPASAEDQRYTLFHVLRRRLHSHSAWDRTLVILHCAVAHGLSDLTFLVDVGALFYQLATIVPGFAS